jgi:hypothetical protein
MEDLTEMIDRNQIEAKARQLEEAIGETKQSVQNTAVLAGVAIVAVVALAFMVGKRRNRPGKTVVEVYRVK